MKKGYKLFFLMFLFATYIGVQAQEKTISGNVSDDSGPLPGVSVIIKGTSSGTETDFDGNYSIMASVGDILQFSFIGMETVDMTVGGSDSINVVMEAETESLTEVIVTGFGRKVEKRSSTYAVQTMEGEVLSKGVDANVTNALAGRIAGVQVTSSSGSVGASTRIVLRGASSITGNNQPLYVVDGVPIDNTNYGNAGSSGGRDMPNGISDIAADDIESMNVLKGPAAAALYGIRASNGVIEITTKKGKANNNLGITFNSNVQFDNPLILPDYQNSYGQGGDPSYFEFVDGAGGGYGDGVDESWGPPLDVGLEFVQWDNYKYGGAATPWVSHPDNIKDFYETGISLNNNVSFSGGSETTTYRMSIGKLEQTGMVPNTDYERFTVGVNASHKVADKFTTSFTLNYTKAESGNLPFVGYDNENPVQQFIWAGRQVDYKELRDWRNLPLAAEGTAAEGTPLNWNTNFQNNPYWVLDTNLRDLDKDRYVGNIAMNYEINEHFTLSGKVGLDHWNSIATQRRGMGSNNAPNGSYSETIRSFSESNAELLLSYTTMINEDLGFDISGGGNMMYRKRKLNFLNAPELELPDLYNLSNLKAGANYTETNTVYEQKINSLYFFGKFSWRNYLFLEFSGRNDWASVLPPENNSFFYPSVSLSAVITDMIEAENWFLKVRGGWSEVGGIGTLSPYELQPTYELGTPFGSTTTGQLPDQLNNPTIKPESTQGWEVGADLRLFNSRLRLNATYYDQSTTDAIVPVQISSATGYTSAVSNVGEINNKGWEIQLGGTVVDSGDFRFDMDINYARNQNQIVSLGGDLESLVLGGQWSMNLEARPGNPWGDIVGSYFERAPDGQIIFENGLPQIADGTKVLGNVTPDWQGGVNFDFTYKRFNLSMLFDAKIGGDVYSMTTSWGRYAGVLEETLLGRETGIVGDGVMVDPVTGAYVPNNVVRTAEDYNKAAYSNSIVESSVFDASYVKFKQLTLGYSLPSKFLDKSLFDAVSFSLVGNNLAILHKNVPHIDPETAFSDDNSEQGQEFGQQPTARSVGFNINIKL